MTYSVSNPRKPREASVAREVRKPKPPRVVAVIDPAARRIVKVPHA